VVGRVAPDLATLDLYCDRVAAAVGRLSVRAFGDASPAADRVAHALGRALQLTNILRDVAEDAARGRLYLPREWLEEAGVPRDPAGALAAPALGVVCARVAGLAHRHFREAEAAMRECAPVVGGPRTPSARRATPSRSTSSHSQTTKTRHPISASRRSLSRSRSAFWANFGPQYSRRDLGTRAWRQPWCWCQKQPWTWITTPRPGKTRSGRPGKSQRCRRKR